MPLIKKVKSNDVQESIQSEVFKNANLLKPASVGSSKVGKKGEFYGVDIGAAGALIIGVDVNLKLGFKR